MLNEHSLEDGMELCDEPSKEKKNDIVDNQLFTILLISVKALKKK